MGSGVDKEFSDDKNLTPDKDDGGLGGETGGGGGDEYRSGDVLKVNVDTKNNINNNTESLEAGGDGGDGVEATALVGNSGDDCGGDVRKEAVGFSVFVEECACQGSCIFTYFLKLNF